MTSHARVGELLEYVIGGGWGGELPGDDSVPVVIIRGADFPAVRHGDVSTLPLRYETTARANTRALREGDIVLEISGGTKGRPTGRTVYVHNRLLNDAQATLIPASFCRLLRPARDRVDPRYLYYWLQDMYAQGRTWAYQVQSTGLANFQMKLFLEREVVWIPSLDEQRRIAGVLGALDDLIDTNQALVSALDGLFHREWERRFAASQAAATSTLADVCETQYGYTESATTEAVGPRFLRVADINKTNWINWSTVPYCKIDDSAHAKYRLRARDLVVARMADPGKSAIIDDEVDAVFASYLVRLTPINPIMAFYLYGFLKSSHYLEYARGATTGSVQKNMNAKVITACRVFVPPVEAVSDFDRAMSPVRSMMAQLLNENAQLIATRGELLPLLLSGRVRVDEVAG